MKNKRFIKIRYVKIKSRSAILVFMVFLLLSSCREKDSAPEVKSEQIKNIEFGLVIHGGAGGMKKENYSDEIEKEYSDKLNEALLVGYNILKDGGSALDAVEKTIHVLEDSPLFNAGKGAVMTGEKTIELDAAIMNGADLNAGTCAGIKHIKNPISLARSIMEKSQHVMLIGEGAESFAKEVGLEWVDNNYFFTDKRLKEIEKMKAEERLKKSGETAITTEENYTKFGTVGCAALDKNGNLASGTSTGGMANKKWGRVGDVPIIGAGTYANNNTCALSATGHGEYFIRNVVTHDISALMEYKGFTLQQAADEVVKNKLVRQKGAGGVIGIDKLGNITMTFNTNGMFRGFITDKGEPFTAIYKN